MLGVSKNADHETLRWKYPLFRQIDRVGRMADILEFSYAALPKERLSEEFAIFLKKNHADLRDGEFWQQTQDAIRRGVINDFYPYQKSPRFCNAFGQGCPRG